MIAILEVDKKSMIKLKKPEKLFENKINFLSQ